MSFDPKVIEALAEARIAVRRMGKPGVVDNFDRYQEQGLRLLQAINALDEAGVFAALDEQTDYASAVEILAESAVKAAAEDRFNFEHPAEQPRQDGYAAASGLGKLERVPGTDTLRPAPGEGFTQDQARALFGDTD